MLLNCGPPADYILKPTIANEQTVVRAIPELARQIHDTSVDYSEWHDRRKFLAPQRSLVRALIMVVKYIVMPSGRSHRRHALNSFKIGSRQRRIINPFQQRFRHIMLNDFGAVTIEHLQDVRKCTRSFTSVAACEPRFHRYFVATLQCEKEAVVPSSRKNADMRHSRSKLHKPQNCVLAILRYPRNANILDAGGLASRGEFT